MDLESTLAMLTIMTVRIFGTLCVLLGATFGIGAENSAEPAPMTLTTNRVLSIDKTFAKLPGGKAALTVSALRRTNDIFGGEFQLKVTPYFFKSDKGTLEITITDEMMAKAAKGEAVEVLGTAKSANKNATPRKIKGTATPLDATQGALKLWVSADERVLFFETKYRFAE